MKKYKIILISIFIILLTTIIVYAQTSTEITENNTEIITNEILDVSSTLLTQLNSTEKISEKQIITDKLTGETFYEISNDKYSIKFDKSSNLIGIYSKYISSKEIINQLDKNSVQNYIISKYESLNLPEEYELSYLEILDNEIWEADFSKNYNGIYNKYESVKIFFVPENDEIISLTHFNEPIDFSDITVSEEDAISTVENNLNINASEIISSTLTMEKANSYYDESNSDKSIHTSWVLQTSDNEFIYVDANDNSIIGGDCINE